MPKYRVTSPVGGLVNGREWPAVGGEIEFASSVVMPELALVDEANEESRPAPTASVEKRPARKRVAKP